MTGFVIGDVTVANGSASNFAGSGASYTFDVSPTADGDVTIDVAGAVAQDAATNDNTAATQFTIESDQTSPTVSISALQADPTNADPINVTVTFSEDVTGFVIGDVTVGNGSASNFAGTGATYTFEVSPTADGDVTIDIAGAVAQDAATNDNTAATQFTIESDQTSPTANITEVTPDPRQETVSVAATFDEDVTGFGIDDVALTLDGNNVDISALSVTGSGSSYSIDLTSVTANQGDYVLTINASGSGIVDAANNELGAVATESWTFAAAGADATDGNVVVSDVGGSSDDKLVLSVAGDSTQFSSNGTLAAGNGSSQVDDVTIAFDSTPNTVTIDAGDGDDTLTIDLRNGNPLGTDGVINFNGGAGNDELIVIDQDGTATSVSGEYLPDGTNSTDGVVTIALITGGTLTINFTELEPVEINGVPTFTFTSANSNDVITLGATSGSGGEAALLTSGTSAGTAFESLTLFDVGAFTVDLAANDGVNGDDSIRLASGLDQASDIARGLSDLTITTGAGSNTVDVAGTVDLSGTLTINGALISGGGSIASTLTVGSGSNLSPGPNTDVLPTGNLTIASDATLSIDVVNATAGTGHDQVDVSGTVDVTGSTLTVTATGASLAATDEFVIVNNDDTDAVVGTFNGLAEGAVFTADGSAFILSYVGGDGNDITLAPVTVEFSAASFNVSENGTGSVTLTRNTANGTADVQVTLTAGTALAGSDYTDAPVDVSFAEGETSQTVTLPLINDNVVERDETFTLAVTATSGTLIAAQSSATVNLTNDDTAEFSITDISGDEDAGAITVTVTLSNPVDVETAVDVSTTDGSATTADSDYTAITNQTLTFAAGETTQTFDVTPTPELIVEQDETISVSLSNVSNDSRSVTASSVAGTVTVTNDDSLPLLIVGSTNPAAGTLAEVIGPATGEVVLTIAAPPGIFDGGVRVAAADVNEDGVQDMVAASGPGGSSVVQVYDGTTGE